MSSWSPARRLVAYVAGLVAVFGAGFGIGSFGDDIEPMPTPEHGVHAPESTSTTIKAPSGWGSGHDHLSDHGTEVAP
jgi:hypothetical protein